MVNLLRGDVAIKLLDTVYALRPTFETLSAIEANAGKSVMTLAEECASGKISLTDMVSVINHAVQSADGNTLTKEVLGNEIIRQGVGNILVPVSQFLSVALTGEVPQEKKPEVTQETSG